MRHQSQKKFAMIELSDTRAYPGTVVVKFHHATPTTVTVFHPVSFQAFAQAAELLQCRRGGGEGVEGKEDLGLLFLLVLFLLAFFVVADGEVIGLVNGRIIVQ